MHDSELGMRAGVPTKECCDLVLLGNGRTGRLQPECRVTSHQSTFTKVLEVKPAQPPRLVP